MLAQAFAGVLFSLTLSYNRLVLVCFNLALLAGMQSEPSAHFGWVESLSLWRGAFVENAKRTLYALRVVRVALAVARCTFCKCKVNAKRALCALWVGRIALVVAQCVRVLKMQSESSAHFGALAVERCTC